MNYNIGGYGQEPPQPDMQRAMAMVRTSQAIKTGQACSSCRRDKVRCDQQRPCDRCLQKGYDPNQCVTGCANCRKARVKCQNGVPCLRCQDKGVECLPASPNPQTRHGRPAQSPAPFPKPSTDRVKTACKACRKDNKKCDKQRPCTRCTTRGVDCVQAEPEPKSGKLRCEACRQNNKKCGDDRPCRYCREADLECVENGRRKGGPGVRMKRACVNCRRDKVRCDEDYPCGPCDRKNYECSNGEMSSPTIPQSSGSSYSNFPQHAPLASPTPHIFYHYSAPGYPPQTRMDPSMYLDPSL